LRKNADGTGYEAINVSTTYNANKKYEQERLKKEFKGEKNIYVCVSDFFKIFRGTRKLVM
jgi:hypothetical protein